MRPCSSEPFFITAIIFGRVLQGLIKCHYETILYLLLYKYLSNLGLGHKIYVNMYNSINPLKGSWPGNQLANIAQS